MTEQAGQRGGAPSTSKRVRYNDANDVNNNDEDEDNAGNLDFAEQDRKRNQQGRKGRVVTAGYDSEDSDEDDDGDAAGGGKIAGVDPDGDEDDDMFDVDEAKEKQAKAGKGNKGKSDGFLSLNEIEGQEFESGDRMGALSGESDDDADRDPDLELEADSDEEQDEDEEEDPVAAGERTPPMSPGGTTVLPRKPKKSAGKKKRNLPSDPKQALFADMGYKLDGFNMKNEMDSGRFDTEGNYIANAKDPHDEHDKWLQGAYSRKSIRAAREAQKKREDEVRARETQGEALDTKSQAELLKKTVELMQRGESVLETLQRLGAEANKHRPKRKQSTKRGAVEGPESDATSQATGPPPKHESVTTFETFTSLTSTLMTNFNRYNLYDEEFELLLREVRRSGLVPQDWDPIRERETAMADLLGDDGDDDDDDDATQQFIYRWSPAYLAEMNQGTPPTSSTPPETFGPFSLSDLKSWQKEGYFGSLDQAERILLKPYVDGTDKQDPDGWNSWKNLVK